MMLSQERTVCYYYLGIDRLVFFDENAARCLNCGQRPKVIRIRALVSSVFHDFNKNVIIDTVTEAVACFDRNAR